MKDKIKEYYQKYRELTYAGIHIHGIVVLILYIVAIVWFVKFASWLIATFGLDVKSFWIGFFIPFVLGMAGGIYVIADNAGIVGEWTERLNFKDGFGRHKNK